MRTVVASLCTLEPQVVAHAAEMFDVLSDPAIYEFENAPPSSAQGLAERYARLESRGPADGAELWLNWVVRLPDGCLAGYVQATVQPAGWSFVAYELASRYWRRGIGRDAVAAMLGELARHHGVDTFIAVLKRANYRSRRLLESLGFGPANAAQSTLAGAGSDEDVMVLKATAPAATLSSMTTRTLPVSDTHLPTAAYSVVSPTTVRAGELTRGPWDAQHQHAGPPIAMVCRAIEAVAREQGLTHVGRLTANLLRPLPIAELGIEVTTDYSGRNAAHYSA